MFGLVKDSYLDLAELAKDREKLHGSEPLDFSGDSKFGFLDFQGNLCPLTILDEKPRQPKSLWCCLFPYWQSSTRTSIYPVEAAKSAVIEECINQRQRSLIPHSNENEAALKIQRKSKEKKKVTFAKRAHVFPVKPAKKMKTKEKSKIWWQRSDYEEFQETAKAISQAKPGKETEKWLPISSPTLCNGDASQTLKRALVMSMCNQNGPRSHLPVSREYRDERVRENKWWRNFGHSRRGLEHAICLEEGKERELRTRRSKRLVLEEQARQKVLNETHKLAVCSERVRMIYVLSTGWARDLALAAAASDADAVAQNFDDSSRKSREFFLLCIKNKNFIEWGGRKNDANSSFSLCQTTSNSSFTVNPAEDNPQSPYSNQPAKYFEIPVLPKHSEKWTPIQPIYNLCRVKT